MSITPQKSNSIANSPSFLMHHKHRKVRIERNQEIRRLKHIPEKKAKKYNWKSERRQIHEKHRLIMMQSKSIPQKKK